MKLNKIFADGMVFQANKPIRIFGTGKGKVKATLENITVSKEFFEDKWLLELEPLQYGGPYNLNLDLNGDAIVIKDVYIGEVILLAGQSNIAMSLSGTSYDKKNIEDNSLVRFFASELYENQGHFSSDDGWIYCTKENAPHFSAIGYHIGMQLFKEKGIAVGLIACYLGSSVIESWIPSEIAKDKRFYLPKEEKYDSPYVHGPHNEAGKLYSVRQQSVVPFALGNVVWYQGESNTGRSEWKVYTDLLQALIICWRKDFLNDGLPFVVVQIADWDERTDYGWKGIQEAQEKITERLENVKLVKSADVCETYDIHPPTKIHLANRIFESLK